jgi:N-acetyl sugar amidotransferase
MNSAAKYRICTRCIMDTSDPEITFDGQGRCNHCTAAIERMSRELLPPAARREAMERLAEVVRAEGRGKEYDCIIGVSGGVDSTTTAYYTKQLGLRPLAVHFDNGWDSELAVDNIRRTLNALGIDLFTHVVDWEEFRDLQLCFLKASVANAEAPTDHGITATLFRAAHRQNVRFILSGSNLATEAIMPHAWGHYNQDLRLLKALHRRFGTRPLRTMPMIGISNYLVSVFLLGIRQIPFLNYIEYDKQEAKDMLAREIGWRDYGGKHYESIWTRFFQGYYLPVKFGFDKRKPHLSSLICSGQMTREHALEEIEKPVYPPELLRQDMQFVMKKLELDQAQFDAILGAPLRQASQYPSNHFLFHEMGRYKNVFRHIATAAR